MPAHRGPSPDAAGRRGASPALAVDAGAQELRRNLSSYLLLTMKRASLKNLRIGSPCNVGVNCGVAERRGPSAACSRSAG